METKAIFNKSSMQAQVASSRSIEWMVNSYNEWQQRSPLHTRPRSTLFSRLKLLSTKVVK